MATTCSSSWFMMMFIRSLPAMVSNAKLSGAICTVSRSLGTDVAEALPESSRSSIRTVISSEGSNPKSFLWKSKAFRNVRAACGTR